jgi:2-polyprenyl-6-methoxyphenol hydroxylase-like FAD-dependent oxidoreductase
MTTTRTGACIVGGGPAGLLLGLLLAKRGAPVIVLEGHETFDREFRGEVLQPSTAHLLDELGLLGYILEQPHSRLTTGRVRVGGKTAGEFNFARISPAYPYAIWMPQPVFLDALRRKAEPFGTFQCWMGARVRELIDEAGVVTGVKGLRQGQKPFEIRADVVVGADGRFSAMRRLGQFDVEYEHHDLDVIWFVIDQPSDWPSTIYISLGRETQGLILPKYPHQLQTGLLMPPDGWRHWREAGVATVAERIRRFDPIFKGFADALTDFTPFFPLPGTISLVREWARDGLVLIGDAAHTMSPAGAIGVNVALASAAVAAHVIFPRLGQGPIPRSALAEIQRLREDDVRTLHRVQRGVATAIAPGGGTPFTRWLRALLVPLVVRSPLLPLIQRRVFFTVPLPPLDPAFSFRS